MRIAREDLFGGGREGRTLEGSVVSNLSRYLEELTKVNSRPKGVEICEQEKKSAERERWSRSLNEVKERTNRSRG